MTAANDAVVLEARDLHKRYGDNEVLKGVDFSVDRGQVKAILGRSGSGKSTILRLMNLLEPADQGQVRLNGSLIGRSQDGKPLREGALADQRRHIGMVFQRFNLFTHMRVVDNVASGLVLASGVNKREANERAGVMLERVGMAKWARHYPSELSGGQQQRVAIARALVMEPSVMLFDEPTSALDPELVGEVLSVIEELAASGMTMVVVTHETGFAKHVADEVALFHEGRIVEQSPPEEFFGAPQHEATINYLSHIR